MDRSGVEMTAARRVERALATSRMPLPDPWSWLACIAIVGASITARIAVADAWPAMESSAMLAPALIALPLLCGLGPALIGALALAIGHGRSQGLGAAVVLAEFLVMSTVVLAIWTLIAGLRSARETRRRAEAATRLADRRREEAELLKDELRHRMRNLLSVVGGLASASFAGGEQRENLRRFRDRLDAHIRAHDLVFARAEEEISLRDLLRTVLVAFPTDRLTLEGAETVVRADAAATLGLVLHELATNAQKHGAWSTGNGVVRLRVEGDRTGGIRAIEWREAGGPSPEPAPGRKGFGSKVLGPLLTTALGGTVAQDFPLEGMVWRFTAEAGTAEVPEAAMSA